MSVSPAPDKELPQEEEAAVVGGGPAGLRAAEVLAEAGCRVALYEQKPSVGRKFLVAGRGGLNLTHSEALAGFVRRYEDEPARWHGLLTDFGPADLRAWAGGLGIETYVGTSGRVFPLGQQAAALLRRWVARLRTLGVVFHVHHRLERLEKLPAAAGGWQLAFHDARADAERRTTARAVVLALGGASWPQTGSDGRWTVHLRSLGVPVADWQPANCGFEVPWDPRVLLAAEGLPIKNIAVTAGERTVPGELLVTRYGLEGGALYQLGRVLRGMKSPRLWIDFKPGVSAEQLRQRLPVRRHSAPGWPEIARGWRLGAAAMALLEFQGPERRPPGEGLAAWVKRFPLDLLGPRPLAEAISSAGGVAWSALGDDLMLAAHPGLFLAGEMIDWEAPTGGYLLQGSFSTGTRAGRRAGRYLRR